MTNRYIETARRFLRSHEDPLASHPSAALALAAALRDGLGQHPLDLWPAVVAELHPSLKSDALPGLSPDTVSRVVAGLNRTTRERHLSPERFEVAATPGTGLVIEHVAKAPEQLLALLHGLALGRLATLRLLLFVVARAWRQQFVQKLREPTRITIDGGWTEVARLVGMPGQKAPTQLREAAEVLDHVRVAIGSAKYPVLVLARDTKRGTVVLVAEGPLRPRWLNEAKQHGLHGPELRHLVPLPPPRKMPPAVGGPTTHASQWLLVMLVFREFRRAAEELVEHDNVIVARSRWNELADEAGVSKKQLPRVIDRWLSPNGVQFLQPGLRSGSFDLGPPFGAEREVIRAGGRKSTEGRKRRRGRSKRRE